MTSFKVGDRVAVYHANYYGGERLVGTVIEVDAHADMLLVNPDISELGRPYVHPKQCRKLVKKSARPSAPGFREEWDKYTETVMRCLRNGRLRRKQK